MAARPYASTGRASGLWSVRTSSLWAFIELRMARSSQKSGSSVRDLEGKPLQGQTHGLKDKTVGHVFRFRGGKIARFDIQDVA